MSAISIQEQRSYEFRKRVVLWMTVSILTILFFAFLQVKRAYALPIPNLTPAASFLDSDDSFWEIMKDLTVDHFSNGLAFDEITKVISGVQSLEAEAPYIDNFYKAMKGLGMGLAIVFLYIKIIKEALRGEITVEMWLRFFVYMVITCSVIIYSDTITKALSELGLAIAGMASSQISTGGTSALAVTLDETNPTDNLPFLGKVIKALAGGASQAVAKSFTLPFYFILSLGSRLSRLLLPMAALSVEIEILIRRAFIPLAICDVTGEGVRGPGVTYLKKYFALYLVFAAYYMIAAIQTAVNAKVASGELVVMGKMGYISQLITGIMVNSACGKMYFSVKSLMNDVVGS